MTFEEKYVDEETGEIDSCEKDVISAENQLQNHKIGHEMKSETKGINVFFDKRTGINFADTAGYGGFNLKF